MPTSLTDRLLEQIVADPSDPAPKLVLADVLEEQSEDRLARAVRWCAEHGKWPEFRPEQSKPWQWWRCPSDGRFMERFLKNHQQPRRYLAAILPAGIENYMDRLSFNQERGLWNAGTWEGAILFLADALEAQCRHP